MRLPSFLLAVLTPCSTLACAGIHPANEPPRRAPPRVEPQVEDLPAAPPEPGLSRVVFDAEGDTAKVSRVTAVMNYHVPERPRLDGKTPLAPPRMEEPLCVTPCAVDIRHGSHTFVFTSTRDPERSSTADVTLPSKATTMFVRHAIGREGHISGAYVGGAMVGLLGTGLTLMGGLVTTFGAVGEPTRREDGTMSDPRNLVVPGLVVLGVGLVTMVIGGVVMSNNRPVRQPGSTTTWTKPAPPAPADAPAPQEAPSIEPRPATP